MASVKNPYSFLRSVEGTYSFYDNQKLVVEGIVNPSIQLTIETDPNTQQTLYKFEYFDDKLFAYMQQGSLRRARARTATVQPKSNVTIVSKEQSAEYKKQMNAKQASDKATQQNTSNPDGFLQSMESGYGGKGSTPNNEKINALTKNTGAYGGGISSLVYPADLITNPYGYNGCYTVFFISEHPGSAIARSKVLDAGGQFINAQGSNIQSAGSSIDKENYEYIQKKVLQVGVGIAVSKFASKTIQGTQALSSGSINKSASGALFGSLLSLGAGAAAAGGAGLVYDKIKDKISLLENNTQYQQLNVAIALPTPRIEDKHTLRWDGSKGAAIGGGILELIRSANGVNIDRLFSLDVFDELKRVGNLQNERGEKKGSVVANTAGAAADALAMSMASNNSEFGTTLAVMAGKKVNPRKEQLFDEVEFRTFTMQFDLAARSAKDMENIESIIRIFKYHAYPELTPGNFMWIYPAHFDIVHYYRDQVNYHMPRHATSVLTNIDVDYAGGQSFISVHHDGSPVMIKLTLTFNEIAILSRDSIKQGY